MRGLWERVGMTYARRDMRSRFGILRDVNVYGVTYIKHKISDEAYSKLPIKEKKKFVKIW